MAHKSISSIGFGIVAAALAGAVLWGCDSAPVAPPPADAKAKVQAPKDAAAAKGPKRLEAKRASSAAAPSDPTASLLNPGDELEAAPAASPKPAAGAPGARLVR